MRTETETELETMFLKHPVMMAGSVESDAVNVLQALAGFSLPHDYRDFVTRYGGATVGPYSIYGLKAAKTMGKSEASAWEVTQRFRSDGWPGCDKWLVISTDHAGNPIGLSEDGSIWISDHDAGAIQQIASSFEEYLIKWCLKVSRKAS